MPAPECTYWPSKKSSCLRPVVPCKDCGGTGGHVDHYEGKCLACNGIGGDRCAQHQREEE